MQHCTILYCTTQHYTVSYNTGPYCIILYCIVQHCTILYHKTQHYTVSYNTAPYCIIQHCTILYHTTLHFFTLASTSQYRALLHCRGVHGGVWCVAHCGCGRRHTRRVLLGMEQVRTVRYGIRSTVQVEVQIPHTGYNRIKEKLGEKRREVNCHSR